MTTFLCNKNSFETLWIVIPCYNDSLRLSKFLPDLCEKMQFSPISVKILVVDDGSNIEEKNTLENLVKTLKFLFPFLESVFYQKENQGKGAAILQGWLVNSKATWYAFLDADGAISASEVLRLINILNEKKSKNISLFASRIKMRGKIIVRSKKRHYAGRIFASLIGKLIDENIYDSQCGFKIIPYASYKEICNFFSEKGFSFDVELLALLNKFQFQIEEVPINWIDIPGSKVSLFKDSFKMLKAIYKIRSNINKIN